MGNSPSDDIRCTAKRVAEGTRTLDPQSHNLMLYPTELQPPCSLVLASKGLTITGKCLAIFLVNKHEELPARKYYLSGGHAMPRKVRVGRKRGGCNKGYFHRAGRGWFELDNARKFVPLVDDAGERIRTADCPGDVPMPDSSRRNLRSPQ
jgi:hypothetical protein